MAASTTQHARDAAKPHAQSALVYLARFGYAARAVVYFIVGGLAALAATGSGGQATGSRGALRSLMDEPLGYTLLVVIAIGLLGYALWRFVQAWWDTDNHGREAKGIAVRVGLAVSAVTHIILAAWALTLVFAGTGSNEGEGSGRAAWVAWLLGLPGGRLWVALIGVAIVGAGVAQFFKGYKYKFEERLAMDYNRWPWARTLCRVGLGIRGIVFGILGFFFLQAAWESDASETRGLGGTLEWLQQQPWGWVLLAIAALGLIAFAIYSLVEAIYRRIDTPDQLRATPA